MGLRPVAMQKVGLIGLRSDEERILTVLHDLRLAQIEPLSPSTAAELGPERGSETLRRIGDESLRFRGLRAALPPTPGARPRLFGSLDEVLALAATVTIDSEVGELVREDDRLQTEAKSADDTLALLGKLAFFPDRLDLLRSKSVLAFYGEGAADAVARVRQALAAVGDATILPGPSEETTSFLVVGRSSLGEALASAAQREGIRLVAIPELSATVSEERERLQRRREAIAARRREIHDRLRELSGQWYATVAAIDEALEVENRKTEALTRLGATGSTFALEAWVPKRDVGRLRSIVEEVTAGRVLFTEVPTSEEPPTMLANPAGVRRFEFFVRFYSLPQASEWDPTLVFSIVFPIFFGFMLGDWGYGLVILLISVWMIRGFPGAQRLPGFGRRFVKTIMGPKGMQQLAYALLPGCVIAMGLGLIWDECFGFTIFHTLFGYVPPIAPERNVGLLLLFAGYVGLAMVVLGFLFGAVKEYLHHHRRAVVAKLGGIAFAVGIAFFGLALIHQADSPAAHPIVWAWIACIAVGFACMFSEGVQHAMLGLIEVISHILSYTRLVGILLASVILAVVINTVSFGLFHSHGAAAVALFVGGLVILVAGQAFNVILGVFEPGIQGARLIFVEYFSKFYTGNGRPFRPFGAARTHTVPSVDANGKLEPIVRTPES
jgi:V/A-type H+/Na+-transporting ATPase subunit I